MRSLRTAKMGVLRWLQPGNLSLDYDLCEGEDLLGRLRWQTSCGTLARAECADGQWTFKRQGFMNPCVTARASGCEANVAVFQPRLWGDGRLELSSGRMLDWKPCSFWRNEWSMSGPEGERILGFKPENTKGLKGLFKSEGRADFPPSALTLPEFPLLVFLGWYLLVLQRRDSEATVATVASVG